MQPLGRSEALDYLDVPAEVFTALVEADHPWTTWHEHITSSYDYERLA